MVRARKVSREDLRVATASRFDLAVLARPTTCASVNGIKVVDKEKDRGPGLGWKELKQIHTVVCSVRERS